MTAEFHIVSVKPQRSKRF